MTTSGDDPEYYWDLLNRMTAYFPDGDPGDETRYAYRADGMRTVKVESTSSYETETKYYYDGQMGVIDVEVYDPASGPNVTTVRKYGVGARGIDVITKKVDSGSETFGYPLYDTHGNMVATLARSGSHDYSVGNVQMYDVWGGVRSGSSTEDQGFAGQLAHRRDSESSLIYMRARYCDPLTGRFLNEDPRADGHNWYVYAGNLPTCMVDDTGTSYDWFKIGFGLSIGGFLLAAIGVAGHLMSRLNALQVWTNAVTATVAFAAAVVCFGYGFANVPGDGKRFIGIAFAMAMGTVLNGWMGASLKAIEENCRKMGRVVRGSGAFLALKAGTACAAYSLAVLGALLAMEIEDMMVAWESQSN